MIHIDDDFCPGLPTGVLFCQGHAVEGLFLIGMAMVPFADMFNHKASIMKLAGDFELEGALMSTAQNKLLDQSGVLPSTGPKHMPCMCSH